MRDRFLQQEVWERMGCDVRKTTKVLLEAPQRQMFQQMLFSKIVPNCRKLGLLDAADGWLRERFTELGSSPSSTGRTPPPSWPSPRSLLSKALSRAGRGA